MPGIAILTGPPAPLGAPLGFCAVCAGIGKSHAGADVKDEIARFEATGQGSRTWPLKIDRQFLVPAVAWSVVPALGAALPCCWSHLSWVEVGPGSRIVQAAPGVPRLGNGGG